MSARSAKKKLKLSRAAELALILLAAVTVVLVIFLGFQVTRGVSKTVETPEHIVRLEILNGCQVGGIAGRVAKELARMETAELEIQVLSTGDFDLRKVGKSFIISRDQDTEPAETLARALGLDPSKVIYRPLENNYQQISVTLVLGEDFQEMKPMALTNEE